MSAASATDPKPSGGRAISLFRRSLSSLALMAFLGGILDYSIFSVSQQLLYTSNATNARKAMTLAPYQPSLRSNSNQKLPLDSVRQEILEVVSASSQYATADAATQRQQHRERSAILEPYQPSSVEDYVFEHAERLGLTSLHNPSGCDMWRNATEYIARTIRPPFEGKERAPMVPDEQSQQFAWYLEELKVHTQLVENFTLPDDVTNLVQALRTSTDPHATCELVNLHLDTVFAKSQQLSRVPLLGHVEPLFPPLRHPEMCFDKLGRGKPKHMMDLTYMLHDWSAMCRQLTPYSRIVLIDMGASLAFHGRDQPAVYLTDMYRKFGLPFDHVYAYEIKQQQPADVFKMVPDQLSAAYHWINVGVDPVPGAANNPFTMLKKHYRPEDLVVVKLDVDNSPVEMALVQQLMEDVELQGLVDQFYFENHVHLQELSKDWRRSMEGTVFESMTLFSKLRKLGVASHSWV